MFIFPVQYFSLILNPEIKFIILKRTFFKKYRKIMAEIIGRGFLKLNSTHQKLNRSMKTKLWFAVMASFLSMTAFSQKKKQPEKISGKPQEMAVYAEKRGADYYLVRTEKDKTFPMSMYIPMV